MVMVVTGCANINHNLGNERWFNPSLPIHLQHTLFEQERQFCRQATKHWTPLPDIKFSSNGVRRLNGAANVSVEGAHRTSPIAPRRTLALSCQWLRNHDLAKNICQRSSLRSHSQSCSQLSDFPWMARRQRHMGRYASCTKRDNFC